MSEQLEQLAREAVNHASNHGLGFVAKELLEQFAMTVMLTATADLRREVEELTERLKVQAKYAELLATREQVVAENDRLRSALTSGFCSEHSTPDPLHCDTCNMVKWLHNTNTERMEQIEKLQSEVTHWQTSYESACASLNIYLLIEKDHQIKTEEVKRLRSALERVAAKLDTDNQTGYSADDKEGAMHIAFGIATAALKPA